MTTGSLNNFRDDPTVDPVAALAALGVAGAGKFDPLSFHYIEVLAQRRLQHQGEVREHLESKLTAALRDLQARFNRAQSDAIDRIKHIKYNLQTIDKIEKLDDYLAQGDLKALNRRISFLEQGPRSSPLAELTRHIEQLAPSFSEAGVAEQSGPSTELKAIRYYRDTWSKLSVDKQVAKAIENAPDNAGPLNSHYLVLRSLELMREISPDYLNRFMSYVDTLLCLEQAERKSRQPVKKAAAKTKAKPKKAKAADNP
jgi:hypothetical protein